QSGRSRPRRSLCCRSPPGSRRIARRRDMSAQNISAPGRAWRRSPRRNPAALFPAADRAHIHPPGRQNARARAVFERSLWPLAPPKTAPADTISDMALPIILGIESSCDETAAAVVRGGEELLSNVVFSQIAAHQRFGGVVPEIASREHLRGIVPVVRLALEQAKQAYASIDAIAVTQGPGLAGALLVGVTYAKALAFAEEKPVIAVNHLEGHIHAVLLEEKQKGNRELEFPVLALVVSGGHTHLYLCE